MRIHLLSDLHLGHGPYFPAPVDADVVVLAGDIADGGLGGQGVVDRFAALLGEFRMRGQPVVFVPGNHEYYRRDKTRELGRLRDFARELGCVLLQDDALVLQGVRFYGSTLWTDFELHGAASLPLALVDAQRSLADFHYIESGGVRWTPAMSADEHHSSVARMRKTLGEPFDGPTVVVTHHGPARGSVHPMYAGNRLNPCFVSDKEELIHELQPALWLHGHIHSSADYRVGSTRVVANPAGYVLGGGGRENPEFDQTLVLEV